MKYNYIIGNFDGVHRGHQKLIEKCVELSKQNGSIPAAITFDPDPKAIFTGDYSVITTLEQKKELFFKYGIEDVVIIPFDKFFASMSPEFFIKNVLNQLEIDTLIYGSDWRFGDKGSGDHKALVNSSSKNFNVLQVEDLMIDGVKISATTIIKLIKEGKIQQANELLGHQYTMVDETNIVPLAGKYLVNFKGEEREFNFKKFNNKETIFIKELD